MEFIFCAVMLLICGLTMTIQYYENYGRNLWFYNRTLEERNSILHYFMLNGVKYEDAIDRINAVTIEDHIKSIKNDINRCSMYGMTSDEWNNFVRN